jgi:hypothetical protein
MAPWVVLTIDSLKDYYRTLSPDPLIVYHRRNEF